MLRNNFTAAVSMTDETGTVGSDNFPMHAITVKTGVIISQTELYIGTSATLPNMVGWDTIDLWNWLNNNKNTITYIN